MKTETIAIIGLDRIGGSIGMALRTAKLGLTVLGYDAERSLVERAKEMGAVDGSGAGLSGSARAADIIILNTSISRQEETIRVIGTEAREHTLVIDIGGLKGPGLKWANQYLLQGHYVGAGPVLAAAALNDSRAGIQAARADLFAQSVFCIMPSPKADPKAVETAVNLGRILGATPFFLDALEYDSLMQGVESAPSLLAAAMFRAVTQATGWRDMLRFAGQTFALTTWSLENEDLGRMALYNKEATIRWIDAVLVELGNLRRLVLEGDEERLDLVLDDIFIERERWLHERQENNWIDASEASELSNASISGQLFGFRPKSKDKKKSSR